MISVDLVLSSEDDLPFEESLPEPEDVGDGLTFTLTFVFFRTLFCASAISFSAWAFIDSITLVGIPCVFAFFIAFLTVLNADNA